MSLSRRSASRRIVAWPIVVSLACRVASQCTSCRRVASQRTVACGAVLRRMGLRDVVSCVLMSLRPIRFSHEPGPGKMATGPVALRRVTMWYGKEPDTFLNVARNRAHPTRCHRPASEAPAGYPLQGTSLLVTT